MHLVTFERREGGSARDPREHSMGSLGLGFEAFESTTPGARRLGAIVQLGRHAGAVVDLNRALAVKLAGADVGAPEAEADSLLPAHMAGFLRRTPDSLDVAREAYDFAVDALDRYDSPDLLRAGVVEPRQHVRLCAPIPRPGKIVGVVGNPPEPAAGRDRSPPIEPLLFLKAPSAVIGPEDEILLPPACKHVDHEGELAVVIGRRARGVPPEQALEYVGGYCAANNVCACDYQDERGQRTIGSSCDTFAPIGPALVTPDEIPDPGDLAIRSVRSGEVLRSGRTKELRFDVAALLSFASRFMTLEPGDLLLTGSPGSQGTTREPTRWLRDGDLVEVEIERVGRLRNYVRASGR
jgi:acylpyruvate hydrolase